MKYKAVIFDLDGTLLNTLEDLADSMNTVLDNFGFPIHPIESYKLFVGKGLRNLVLKTLPEEKISESLVGTCLDAFRKKYAVQWGEKTHPYKDIPELLDKLTAEKIKLAILSNKADEFTQLIVAKFLSQWNFEAVFGERPSVPRKPDPAAALEIAVKLGLKPDECLYIGDSGTDMETANAAGMYAVGALWGFRKADELLAAGAKKLIQKPAELLELL